MERIIIDCYKLKGTKKELDEIEFLMSCELIEDKKFKKYFHVWVHEGTGVYYFPKEKYFVARRLEETWCSGYIVSLLRYGSGLNIKEYSYSCLF